MSTLLRRFLSIVTARKECLALSLLFVIAGVLAVARGPYLFGYELLGAAQAKYLIASEGLVESIRFFAKSRIHFFYWNTTSSFTFGFIPGALAHILPSVLWPSLVVFFITVLVLAILPFKSGGQRTNWVVVLAFLSSSALCSYSIVGYPYIHGSLTYAIGLSWVFFRQQQMLGPASHSRWFAIRWVFAEMLVWLFIFNVSFDCYELAKTAFIVPFLAAIALPSFRPWQRLVFGFISICFALAVLYIGRHDVQHWTGVTGSTLSSLFSSHGMYAVLSSLLRVVQYIVAPPFKLGEPFLMIAACIAFGLARKHKMFWGLFFLFQLALLLQIGSNPQDLRNRRFLLLLFSEAFFIGLSWNNLVGGRRSKVVVSSVLVSGVLISVCHTVSFALGHRQEKESLPFTWVYDNEVDRHLIDDVNRIASLVKLDAHKVVINYGFSDYPENSTAPNAIPERLILSLPWGRFRDGVQFVDPLKCRYSCLPVVDWESFIDSLPDINAPFYFVNYPLTLGKEMLVADQFAASEKEPAALGLTRFVAEKVVTYVPPQIMVAAKINYSETENSAPAGALIQSAPGPAYPIESAPYSALNISEMGHSQLTYPVQYKATRVEGFRFTGLFLNPLDTAQEIRVETYVDDELKLYINDVLLIYSPHLKPQTRILKRIIVPPGLFTLHGLYTNLRGVGALGISVMDQRGKVMMPYTNPPAF